MNREERKVLPLTDAYSFGERKGLKKEIEDIRSMEIEWDRSYTSTVRRGFIVDLFQRMGILEEFKGLHWPVGITSWGNRDAIRLWDSCSTIWHGSTRIWPVPLVGGSS